MKDRFNASDFRFTSQTKGLPDFCILDEDREPSLPVLTKFMDITGGRQQRKHYEGFFGRLASSFKLNHLKNASLFDYYMDPEFRRAHFITILRDIATNRKKAKFSPYASFEFLVFYTIDNDFIKRIDDEEEIDEKFVAVIDDDLYKLYEGHEWIYVIFWKLWERIIEGLNRIGQLPQKEQEEVVAGVFAIATLLGPNFYKTAVRVHPSIELTCFSYIVGLPENEAFGSDADEDIDISAEILDTVTNELLGKEEFSGEFPDNIEESIILLKAFAATLKTENICENRLDSIRKLVDHIQQLAETSATSELFLSAVDAVIALLDEIGSAVKVPGLEDESFKTLLKGAWTRYLAENIQEQIVEKQLQITLQERINEVADATTKYNSAQNEIDAADQNLVKTQATEAKGYLDTQRKKQEIANLEENLLTLKWQIIELDQALHASLLPPGVNIEILEESASPVDELPSLSIDDKNWVDSFTDSIRRNFSENIDQKKAPEDEKKTDAPVVEPKPEPKPVEPEPETEQGPDSVATAAPPEEPLTTSKPDSPDKTDIETSLEDEPDQEITTPVAVKKGKSRDEIELPDVVRKAEASKDPISILATQIKTDLVPERGTEELNPESINQVALHCLKHDLLNLGYRALHNGLFYCPEDQLINPDLFEAALLGGHVWNSSSSVFSQLQKSLNQLVQQKIDAWLGNRTLSKITPHLLFSACFQACLFTGNQTNAPLCLNQIKSYFEGSEVAVLITDLIQFNNRGGRLTLDMLQQKEGKVEAPPTTTIKVQLSDWHSKIVTATRGWAPVRIALSRCLSEGAFSSVHKAIHDNNISKSEEVRSFVETYSLDENARQLMLKAIGELTSVEIEANARTTFMRTVSELVEISSRWLDEQTGSQEMKDSIDTFSRRLIPRLEKVKDLFRDERDCLSDKDARLAAGIAYKCMDRLLSAINGKPDTIWPDERVTLWLNFTRSLLGTTEPSEELVWIVDQMEKGFDLQLFYQKTIDEEAYHLAHVLLSLLSGLGQDVRTKREQLQALIEKALRNLEKQRESLEIGVGTANFAGLIDDDRHSVLISELEYCDDQLKNHSAYMDLRSVATEFDNIQTELDEFFTPRVKKIRDRYESQLTLAKASIGPDAVPSNWEDQMESALANNDIPVAEEMLDALETAVDEKRKVPGEIMAINQIFADFFSIDEKIYAYVAGQTDTRQLADEITNKSQLGLDYKGRTTILKDAIRSLAPFRHNKAQIKIPGTYLINLQDIFQMVGIRLRSTATTGNVSQLLDYRTYDNFAYVRTYVECDPAGAPFTDFGKTPENEAHILVAHRDWDLNTLEKILATELVGKTRLFLLSAMPISRKKRDEFATYCKNNHKTIFLLDLTMLFYLGTLDQTGNGNSTIRNYLHLAVPMTFYNTYVGNKMTPGKAEIRYGREQEIDQLINMDNGAAIVFGGRQLGKSTIVSQVVDNFHDPAHQKFAFYEIADKTFNEAMLDATPEERAKRFWGLLYRNFCSTGKATLNENLTSDQMIDRIQRGLEQDPNLRIIYIFDEVDNLLLADSASDFPIFRGIRGLVSSPKIQGRFKMIISGLQNAKRFEGSPNYPLSQLGRSLNIKILSISDALRLIKEPLLTYGFRFENSLIPSRIMSLTNRHPGLIQIFCDELVRRMAIAHRGSISEQVIHGSDIIWVFDRPEVRNLVRERFELTLDLDTYYSVIVYSLAHEGRGTQAFTAFQARELAGDWLPELKAKTEKQIDAILEELVGLGVFSKVPQGYMLRNSNILRLLGNNTEIGEKLLTEIEKNRTRKANPLERHRYISELHMPSPLSYGDEKQILGQATDTSTPSGIKSSSAYAVSLVSGSAALGLDQLEASLPYIDDFSIEYVYGQHQYKVFPLEDKNFPTLKSFDLKLNQLVSRSKESPLIILVKVSGECPVDMTVDMFNRTLVARDSHRESYKPCKVIFSMNPKALWLWQSGAIDRDQAIPGMTHLSLSSWKESIMEPYLIGINLPHSSDRIKRVMEYTQGWFYPLKVLAQLFHDNPEINAISKFGAQFKRVHEVKKDVSATYIEKVGITAMDWVAPLLRYLLKEQAGRNIDLDTISFAIEVLERDDLNSKQAGPALNWLLRMNLIQPQERKVQEESPVLYDIAPSVSYWLGKTDE